MWLRWEAAPDGFFAVQVHSAQCFLGLLNLLFKSDSFARSNTLNRFFFTPSFSNSACRVPSNPSLMMAFKIALRVSFEARLPVPVVSFSPVASQNATAPSRTTGSTSFSFHLKDRRKRLESMFAVVLVWFPSYLLFLQIFQTCQYLSTSMSE